METKTVRSMHSGLVWVDHHEARLVHPRPGSVEFDVVVVAGDGDRPHEKKHDGGHRHPISAAFADRIAAMLVPVGAIAIAGPSSAKDELIAQLRQRHDEVAARVAVVESLDRGTDAQLAAHARALFERVDRMRGIHVPLG